MKEIPISALRRMTADQIRESGCFRLIADGEMVAVVLIGAEGEMLNRVEGAASQIDAMRGK